MPLAAYPKMRQQGRERRGLTIGQVAWRLGITREPCPREESDLRTRFRKPMLYPLSYGGGSVVEVEPTWSRRRYG